MSKNNSKNARTTQTKYEKTADSPKFKALLSNKKKFIVPLTIFFLIFYFALPIMTSYTTILNKPAIGDISWVWVFAFAQFVMTWTLCIIYVKKFAKFDVDAEEIVKEELEGGRK